MSLFLLHCRQKHLLRVILILPFNFRTLALFVLLRQMKSSVLTFACDIQVSSNDDENQVRQKQSRQFPSVFVIRALSSKMWNSWQGESQQSINFDGKAINGNSRSKQTINQQESCPKQQNGFQTNLSSTFQNLRRRRLKLFVAISCVRQSFRLRARIQVRLSWSRISRLLQLCCTTKKLDLKALLNQSYKETFKWEFGNSLVGHREHSLLHKFKILLSKRCNHKICRGLHDNDSSKCRCDTPVFQLQNLDQWIIPAILEKRLCSLSWKRIRAPLNLLRQKRGLKLKNWISKKIIPQLIKLPQDGPLRHNQSVQLVQILKMSMSITMFASLSYDKGRIG